MGKPKQLLPYQGRSLVRHAVEVALASAYQPIIVVLGAHADQIKPEIPLSTFVVESRWQQGMSASIRAGVETLLQSNSTLDAIIISLADQPLVSPQVFQQLVRHYQQTQKAIVASKYNETIGVPALFSCALFPELIQLQGTKGAKALIQKYADTVSSIPVPEAAIDIDTPEDYEQLLEEIHYQQ